MFQVSGLVLDIFLLILRVPFDLVPDNIHKSSGIAQALAEEGFELRPSYKDSTGVIPPTFVLVPPDIDTVLKKRSCKRDTVGPFAPAVLK